MKDGEDKIKKDFATLNEGIMESFRKLEES